MPERLSDPETAALFRRLFPHGLAGADVLDELAPDGWVRSALRRAFHPMRFYMGLIWIRERCDYGPVYRLVFRRLQRERLDWRFSFPRIRAIRFDREETDQAGPYHYSPSEAFARDQARQVEEAEFARLQADLEEQARAERERARNAPPPAVVRAYADVFGRWPEGWPPSACP